MKTTSVREFRSQISKLIQGKASVLVTRHGKPAAVLVPLTDPDRVPMEIRRELFFDFSRKMGRALKAKGITEEDVLNGFAEFRKSRRGR